MKRTLLIVVAAVAALSATPATAQDFPDLPGMGPVRNAIPAEDGSGLPGADAGSGTTGRATTDPPAAPVAPAAEDSPQLLPTSDTEPELDARPAAATAPTTSGDSLPSTGAAIGGLALLGLALTAGGSLLRELVRGR